MTVAKCEDKLGIRASDTATLIFEDCRIPFDQILGSPEVPKTSEGFKGVMATFDADPPDRRGERARRRPRGARLRARRAEAPGHSRSATASRPTSSPSIERDFMDMEANLQAARLLTWRAAWMMDRGQKNNLEASMAKAKAGLVVTQVTQKAVEMLGPLGYSRDLLLEKWMRDAKINDIFEGTQQINMMIIARRILGYSSKELS
jgi:acyl-CoA dehydrogenase